MPVLLAVKDLRTQFKTDRGLVKAVDGVSFQVNEQEIVSIVGESGCGKSVTQLSVMQLISSPGEIISGEVFFMGENLLEYDPQGPRMRNIRGAKISMVFQEPMTSLNPVLTIGTQLTESLTLHLGMTSAEARERAAELLMMVGIPDAATRLDDYPHHYSGGMRQRMMIAMALSCGPKIIIADEPTTALDVTTQAQLLELMVDMVERFKTSLVIVTHNLGVVARYAHRLYVMYAGRIVESGTSKEIFGNPSHPYTRALLECIPRLDEKKGRKLMPIAGMPPSLVNMPPTCAFLPRCPRHIERCHKEPWPDLHLINGQHYVSCYVE
ncbi:MAG: ABC transporter ATP-binding protein [Deltaproteobacteria bacterium]|nr:ABC transporter ATP-binding protein [Deltaproteobacteria bacterium]